MPDDDRDRSRSRRPSSPTSSASATTTTIGWLRKTAEFDNYRKRVERERREQADQAVVDLLQELLLVVDDFDRALTVDAGDGGSAYRKGVELIHAQAARPAAQAGRHGRSTRSAPTSIRTCTRPSSTRRAPSIARAK